MQKNKTQSNKKISGSQLCLDVLDSNLVGRIEAFSAKDSEQLLRSEALSVVRELWPLVFTVSHPRPLKIGIHKDILATNILPKHIVELAIKYFVTRDRYLEATREGAFRVDLDGNRSGRVSLKEALRADMILYRRHQLRVNHCLSDNRSYIGKFKLVSRKKHTSQNDKSDMLQINQLDNDKTNTNQVVTL